MERKLYDIVTNDRYEFPVECDVLGLQAVADFFKVTPKTIWRRIKSDAWKGKYKAICIGIWDGSDFNHRVKPISERERIERRTKYIQEIRLRRKEEMKGRRREYYLKNKEAILKKAKERYQNKKRAVIR